MMLSPASENLDGRYILVVEDDYLIATNMADSLSALGADVAGPVGSVEEARAMIEAEGDRLDGAILDLNLSGTMSFPLADALLSRRIPFIFATGYGASAVPERYAGVPRCEKPVSMTKIVRTLLS